MQFTRKSVFARRAVGALTLVIALAGCGGGGGGGSSLPVVPPTTQPTAPATPAAPSSASRIENTTLQSASTGALYSIQIYLPPGYDAAATATYPTIYVTDGDARFNLGESRFSNFANILERLGKKAVLIGIGGTSRRNSDFLPPGDQNYHSFLTSELVPLVESKYRADPAKRMLSGLSNGGIFTASAFFMEASAQLVFRYFLAFEGDYGPYSRSQEQRMFELVGNREIPATILLAYGSTSGGATPASSLSGQLTARNYKGLQVILAGYPGGHTPMDLPAFEDAVHRFVD